MSRREFTKATQRLAKARADGHCEALGSWYGLNKGERCNMPLDRGVQYDHIDCDANSKDNSLENCAAVCVRCHSFKTRYIDIPKAAKTLRQQDKHNGIANHKRKWPSRPFKRQAGNVKQLHEEREDAH